MRKALLIALLLVASIFVFEVDAIHKVSSFSIILFFEFSLSHA